MKRQPLFFAIIAALCLATACDGESRWSTRRSGLSTCSTTSGTTTSAACSSWTT